jgi:hypothetical protein
VVIILVVVVILVLVILLVLVVILVLVALYSWSRYMGLPVISCGSIGLV